MTVMLRTSGLQLLADAGTPQRTCGGAAVPSALTVKMPVLGFHGAYLRVCLHELRVPLRGVGGDVGSRPARAPSAARPRWRSSSRPRLRHTARPDSPASAAAVAAAVVAAADLSLIAYGDVVAGCERCALAATRTQVVFGSGSPDADLMFVGEAPGFHEDKQGVPFVGAAGQLLGKLLAGIGLAREDVYRSERPEMPPSRKPRPAAGRDRGLRGPPVPPDRADPAEGRGDARQLRDQAPLRQAEPGSPACTGRSRRSCWADARCCSTRSSIRRRRSTRRGRSTCCRRTSRDYPTCSAGPSSLCRRPRRSPSVRAGRRAAVQLGLF